MQLYVAVLHDKHIDDVIRVCSTMDRAMEYCHVWLEDEANVEVHESLETWPFYATYGYGSSDVHIETCILDEGDA